jgi:hypothetical protein
MGQRISRAKRTIAGVRFNQPGDVATVLRVLYLVFNEGYSGDIDLAAEAIRLTRQLAAKTTHAEVAGLLALMLLQHARRPARTGPDGRLVPLAEQDRGRWDTRMIAEGVDVLQAALARDRLGEFQAQAAIAALHADAQTAAETDWPQIVEWYDELVRLTGSPVARLNRAVAVGEADGPRAGLAALAGLDPGLPRYAAVAAYLHERDGEPRPGSTPRLPGPQPISPNATTSPGRPPGSTHGCALIGLECLRHEVHFPAGQAQGRRPTVTATVLLNGSACASRTCSSSSSALAPLTSPAFFRCSSLVCLKCVIRAPVHTAATPQTETGRQISHSGAPGQRLPPGKAAAARPGRLAGPQVRPGRAQRADQNYAFGGCSQGSPHHHEGLAAEGVARGASGNSP